MQRDSRPNTHGVLSFLGVLLFAGTLWGILVVQQSTLKGASIYWATSLAIAGACGFWCAMREQQRLSNKSEIVVLIDRFASNPNLAITLSPGQLARQEPIMQHLAWASENISNSLEYLQRQGQQNVRVLENMIDGIIVLDEQSRIVGLNPSARRQLQLSADDGMNRPLLDVVRLPEIVQAVKTVFAEKRVHEQMFSVGQHDRRWLRVVASLLPGEPRPGVVVTLHDETRLKALEELRREFVANVSHELKTPLASVKGYAETLLMGAIEDPETCRKFIGIILQQADRLEMLINDMLRLARAQAAPEVLKLVNLQVRDVLQESIASYRPVAARKSLELTLESVATGLEAVADREALLTVVNNLVGNAVRYTPEGGHIWVSAERQDGRCVVAVVDDGPGIPETDCQRIFERFYRVEKSRDSQVAGTGLGLAITKNLVVSMKGTIEVQSKLGFGSRFIVVLQAGG